MADAFGKLAVVEIDGGGLALAPKVILAIFFACAGVSWMPM